MPWSWPWPWPWTPRGVDMSTPQLLHSPSLGSCWWQPSTSIDAQQRAARQPPFAHPNGPLTNPLTSAPRWHHCTPVGGTPPKMVSPIASSAPHGIIGHRMRDITFSQTLLAAILDLGPALAKLEPYILPCVLLYAHACFSFLLVLLLLSTYLTPNKLLV